MMTRVGLVLAILAAFAACGGDDGGNNNGNTCGDGVKAGNEECDDGNTMSGDGCDSVCQIDTAGTCGDGITMVSVEQCDDGNNVDGDGCSASCTNECGNGKIDGGEVCDDGNSASNDGCGANCRIEPLYHCTGEPSVCMKMTGACNDPFEITLTESAGVLSGMGMGSTMNGMNQVPEGPCETYTSGDGADHVWKFTLADTRDVSITMSAGFDAVLRLSTTACDVATEVAEHLGEDGCADEGVDGDGEQLFYTKLPAGTYYVLVDGYDAASIGTYTLTISATATNCGNGMIESNEQCDDGALATGDGCNDFCDVEPGYACDNSPAPSVCAFACGNGQLDAGEECDDANVMAGDRCSPTCKLEYDVLEVEPNDATPQMLTPGTHLLVKGALPGSDYDVFTFTLTAAATVELETYDTMDPDSSYTGAGMLTNVDCFDADTVISLFDTTGDLTDNDTALFTDDQDGSTDCSYLGPNDTDGPDPTEGVLQPGTYRIKVENFFSLFPAERYILDIKVTSGTTPPAGVPPVAGDLVLNEVMADDNTADTNCDGVATTSDTTDEFVELVNVSTKVLDLTGVTVSDSVSVRATLNTSATHGAGASLILQPGKAVVVWAGGTPACPGVTNWFLATANQLGFNNGGDTVTVKNAATQTLATYTYGATTAMKSFNLSPDITGTTYVLHDTLTGAVGSFSPGKKSDGTAF